MKYIINADDFGLHESCSMAIAEAFQRGYITNTTICSNGVFFEKALKIAENNGFSDRIGIHFNITTGNPLTENIRNSTTFCNSDGYFKKPKSKLFMMSKNDKKLLFEELVAQYEKLSSAGIHVNHADSHHHIHTQPAYISTFVCAFNELGIKKVRLLRNCGCNEKTLFLRNIVNSLIFNKRYTTTDYFSGLSDALKFTSKNEDAVFEIMVHPDYVDQTMIDRISYNEYGKPAGKIFEQYSLFFNDQNENFISYNEI